MGPSSDRRRDGLRLRAQFLRTFAAGRRAATLALCLRAVAMTAVLKFFAGEQRRELHHRQLCGPTVSSRNAASLAVSILARSFLTKRQIATHGSPRLMVSSGRFPCRPGEASGLEHAGGRGAMAMTKGTRNTTPIETVRGHAVSRRSPLDQRAAARKSAPGP